LASEEKIRFTYIGRREFTCLTNFGMERRVNYGQKMVKGGDGRMLEENE